MREKLKKFQANLADGIVDSGVTFEQWADNWFNGYKGKVSEATYEGYRYTVRILKNYFGKQLLKDIKPMHVELFLEQQKSEGRSDSYVAKLRGMLFQILNKAEANELIRKNPVRYADVSHLQAMGVDIQTIQYLSGHAEIKMTEHYLHVQNSVKTKAVEKLDAFLSFAPRIDITKNRIDLKTKSSNRVRNVTSRLWSNCGQNRWHEKGNHLKCRHFR